jgi:hypothetical protein
LKHQDKKEVKDEDIISAYHVKHKKKRRRYDSDMSDEFDEYDELTSDYEDEIDGKER